MIVVSWLWPTSDRLFAKRQVLTVAAGGDADRIAGAGLADRCADRLAGAGFGQAVGGVVAGRRDMQGRRAALVGANVAGAALRPRHAALIGAACRWHCCRRPALGCRAARPGSASARRCSGAGQAWDQPAELLPCSWYPGNWMLLPPSIKGQSSLPPAAGLAIIVFRTVTLPWNTQCCPPRRL